VDRFNALRIKFSFHRYDYSIPVKHEIKRIKNELNSVTDGSKNRELLKEIEFLSTLRTDLHEFDCIKFIDVYLMHESEIFHKLFKIAEFNKFILKTTAMETEILKEFIKNCNQFFNPLGFPFSIVTETYLGICIDLIEQQHYNFIQITSSIIPVKSRKFTKILSCLKKSIPSL